VPVIAPDFSRRVVGVTRLFEAPKTSAPGFGLLIVAFALPIAFAFEAFTDFVVVAFAIAFPFRA
jgi:hypothetical protein